LDQAYIVPNRLNRSTPVVKAMPKFDESFEGWDHNIATYITDFVLCVICIFCACSLRCRFATQLRLRISVGIIPTFLAFAIAYSIGALGGGIAHFLIDSYSSKGEAMGLTWNAENSEWMYAWTVSLAALSIGTGALGFIFVDAVFGSVASTGVYKLYLMIKFCLILLSMVVGGFELYLMIEAQLDETGATLACAIFGVSVLGAVFCLLKAFLDRVALNFVCGALLMCAGSALLIFSPESCRKSGNGRDGCPFPEEFNQNAISHTLVTLAVLSFCAGAMAMQHQADEYDKFVQIQREEDERTRASSEAVPETKPFLCCGCSR